MIKQDSKEFVRLGRAEFATLVGNLTGGYPNPDDPGDPNNPFGPYGPIGPVIHAGWRLRLDAIALNPQPLPPRAAFAVGVAQAVIASTVNLHVMADAMGDAGKNSRAFAGTFLSEFDDWCGTMTRYELIRRLLEKLKRWPPPPPPPEPYLKDHLAGKLDAGDLIVIGATLENAARLSLGAELKEQLGGAGARLMDLGLAKMGG